MGRRTRLPTPPIGFRPLPRLRSQARQQSQATPAQPATEVRVFEVIDDDNDPDYDDNALHRRKKMKKNSIAKSHGRARIKKEVVASKSKNRLQQDMSGIKPEQRSRATRTTRQPTAVVSDVSDQKVLYNQFVLAEATRLQEDKTKLEQTVAMDQEKLSRSLHDLQVMETEMLAARALHRASTDALDTLHRKQRTFLTAMHEAIAQIVRYQASIRTQLQLPVVAEPGRPIPWDRLETGSMGAQEDNYLNLIQAYTLVFDETKTTFDAFCRGNQELFQHSLKLQQQASDLNALKQQLEAANWRLNDTNRQLLHDNQALRLEVQGLREANSRLTTSMGRLQNELDVLCRTSRQLHGDMVRVADENKRLRAEIETVTQQLAEFTSQAGEDRTKAREEVEMLQRRLSEAERELIKLAQDALAEVLGGFGATE
ncbi:hypothetical protein CONLIGDRAFT_683233 [Coniochaeta ligniaria NRRL 30616]|uniref:Uncharacterized protein n=1 Tax=Coniochaeta ligniaria NRRL 30616 TaxID=1408157 RepID=A0A1J7IYS7_9PEZI|nr:hypothetical protein CONLIGDRAFT_683233 [Coniochaeta ligniaria NRRL 30616]